MQIPLDNDADLNAWMLAACCLIKLLATVRALLALMLLALACSETIARATSKQELKNFLIFIGFDDN